MEFIQGHLYHIYNRGNNRKRIFFREKNYPFFLQKVRKFISPNCDIISYALMPNHFHFLIYANQITEQQLKKGMIISNPLSEGLRKMLSSYAQAINVQEDSTGSCFQQNTKSKCVTLRHCDYTALCFHYIHQNPYKAGLVKKLESWRYSSFREYLYSPAEPLCNKALGTALLNLKKETFYEDAYKSIEEDQLKSIF